MSTTAAAKRAENEWHRACALERVWPNMGVCVLIRGQQIAVFRVGDTDTVYALDNFDPFSRANLMARGIVGCKGGIPKVSSPMYKQSFDLCTGRCFDDPSIVLPTYEARVDDGWVFVRV